MYRDVNSQHAEHVGVLNLMSEIIYVPTGEQKTHPQEDGEDRLYYAYEMASIGSGYLSARFQTTRSL